MCEVNLNKCTDTNYIKLDVQDYVDSVLASKPDYLDNDDYQDNLYQQIAKDTSSGVVRETLTLGQFTDIHIDLDYVVGSNGNCGDILCCRE
jgi:hypothetical protein